MLQCDARSVRLPNILQMVVLFHFICSSCSYFLDASIGYVTSLFSFFNPIATFASIFPAQDRAHKLANIENEEEQQKKYNSAPANIVCKDGVCTIDMNNNNAIEGSKGSEMNV